MYSPSNLGGHQLVGQLSSAFMEREEIDNVLSIPDNTLHEHREWETLPDMLLLVDAIESYMSWRFAVPGRPWICAASFSYADLYTLYRGGVRLNETGINYVLTNCASYVERSTATMPAKLCYRPMTEKGGRHAGLPTVGAVLPNVKDRDFSLLLWVREKLIQRGMQSRFKVFLHADAEGRLPGKLQFETYTDERRPYGDIDVYVPVPRITDYRSGVIPAEFIQAWHAGCRPLAVFHPNLEPLGIPLYGSLLEIEQDLDKLAEGEDLTPYGPPSEEFCPSMETFVTEVMQGRERWERDRVAH